MGVDSRRKGYRASLTPEQILAIQFRAKCRFKAAVRFVIANLYWLSDVEDEELGEDVQKNVKLLTRKFRKGLLTLTDKSLLNKSIETRTEEDKDYIFKVIGGLKCFRRYPSHVKKQLAAVTYFVYYGPKRVIVKEGDDAHALYFLITGDVVISQAGFDPLLNKKVEINLDEMGPGGMFGEVSLLHNIPRTATVATLNHCELLKLKKEDFNVVLKATVQEQWNDIKRAMKKFTYFDEWDEMTIRECCIMAKMKSYKPDETIFGDGYGLQGYTYFLLQGKCRMIEHIRVLTELVNGIKRYKLYEPPKTSSASIVKEPRAKSLSDPKLKVQESRANIRSDSQVSFKVIKGESQAPIKGKSISGPIDEDEALKRLERASTSGEGSKRVSVSYSRKSSQFNAEELRGNESERDMKKAIIKGSKSTVEGSKTGVRGSRVTIEGSMITMEGSKTKIESKATVESKSDSNIEAFNYMNLLPDLGPSRTTSFEIRPEIIFMQVCLFSPTACFGIGENLKNRRVVAMTPVECLLVPRYWLMQRNTGNVWNLVQHILNHLSTTKQIFKEYVNHKKWLQYRKTLIGDILAKSKIPCENNRSNIPYFIRMNEDINFP